MAAATGPRHLSYREAEAVVEYTPAYVKRLLIERHVIYEALVNPGGSIILRGDIKAVEEVGGQSSIVGNVFHLDLLEAMDALRALPKEQVRVLLAWADGLTDREASEYLSVTPHAVRLRRGYAARKAVKAMNDGRENAGGESNSAAE